MKQLFSAFLLTTLLSAGISNVHAQTDLNKKQFNVSKSGLAIQGYDPVAYFC